MTIISDSESANISNGAPEFSTQVPEADSKLVAVQLQVSKKDRDLIALMAALRGEYPKDTWMRVIELGRDALSQELPFTISPDVKDMLLGLLTRQAPAPEGALAGEAAEE